jgi:hypothetical protein
MKTWMTGFARVPRFSSRRSSFSSVFSNGTAVCVMKR